jgi:hypothetical protein
MNRETGQDERLAWFQRELHYFDRYLQGLPGVEDLSDELHLLQRRSGSEWNERQRKDLEISWTKRSKFERDFSPRRRSEIGDL